MFVRGHVSPPAIKQVSIQHNKLTSMKTGLVCRVCACATGCASGEEHEIWTWLEEDGCAMFRCGPFCGSTHASAQVAWPEERRRERLLSATEIERLTFTRWRCQHEAEAQTAAM